jgi:rod shape determining protein RodA
MFLLCAVGLLFVYSAQISYDGDHWKRQFFFIVVGVGIYSLISALNYKIFLQYAHFIYMAGIVGLVLTMPFSPISVDQMGARRWIDLGITIQPTEGAKIGTLIMAASILARSENRDGRRLLSCVGKGSRSLFTANVVDFPATRPRFIACLSTHDLRPPIHFPTFEKFFLSAFAAFAIALAVLGADIYGYSQYLEAQRTPRDLVPQRNRAWWATTNRCSLFTIIKEIGFLPSSPPT